MSRHNKKNSYIERACIRTVGAVFNREIKGRDWPVTSSVELKPPPLKFIQCPLILDKRHELAYLRATFVLSHNTFSTHLDFELCLPREIPHSGPPLEDFTGEQSVLSCKRSLYLGAKRLRRGQRSSGCIPSSCQLVKTMGP